MYFSTNVSKEFYIHGSMLRESNLITVQQDTTYSVYYISVGSSTCFGEILCPSSGVFHCTHSNGICHTGLLTACEQDQGGTDSARKLYEIYHCCVYSEKLLMMDRGTLRIM